MNISRTALATAILATLIATPAAHAATASASASVYELSLTLVDLNPFDGVAPTLTFNDPYGYNSGAYGYANTYTYDGVSNYTYSNDYYSNDFSTTQFVTAGKALASDGGNVAKASSTASGFSASAKAQLQGDPSTEYDNAQANASVRPNNSGGFYWSNDGFTLSANTALVVKGKYELAASVDATGNPGDYAQANLSIGAQMTSDDGASYQYASFSKSVYAAGGNYSYWWGSSNYLQQDNKSGGFGFALVNGSDNAAMGNFNNVYAGASAYMQTATPSAVPEADATILGLAGLGVVGLAASRRRRSQA